MATFLWKRRRGVTAGVSVAIALFVVIMQTRWTDPAIAVSGGSPYIVPLVNDTNPDPNIVETTITAEPAMVDIGGGVLASVLTFNGSVPGPEFRLKVGDTVIVHFVNNIAHATGIHWHGIELANASDGTPLSQNMVPPGGTFLYKFQVTRPGVYWYHPHHHSSTNQVFKGMYGSIIIIDPNEAALQAAGALPTPAQTKTLVLSDITVCKAPGSNDATTYDSATQPWRDGTFGPLPGQAGSKPVNLCETSPIDEDGNSRLPSPPGLGAYAAGDVPNIQKSGTGGTVVEGQTVLTNGRNVGGRAGSPSAPGAVALDASMLDVEAGQGLRLQLVNTATTRFFRLRLTDGTGTQIPLVRVGGQGGLLDNARLEGGIVGGFNFKYESGEILLDPGDRQDVVVAIPPAATGVLTLWTMDFSRTGGGFSNIPTVPVAHFNVTGAAASTYAIADGTPLRAFTGNLVEVLGAPTGTLLDPTVWPKPGMASQDIRLTNTGSSLGVNSVIGHHDFPGDYSAIPHEGSARYAQLGDTLQLTVTNHTGAHHPFHLHGFSIQPISLTDTLDPPTDGGPDVSTGIGPSYTFPYAEYRDNIDVPGGYTLTFRIRLDDRFLMDGATLGGGLGRWVFHCHIFFHAVFGMISEFDVVAPDGSEKPNVNANAASVVVDEGDLATMTGTYSDPDGDAVTLTGPSVGTFVDNLDGTWSWSHTTNDGEAQILYVTATDSNGLKDQVAFGWVVNNLAPAVTITSPPTGSLFVVGTSVPVTASVTHPDPAEALTCAFGWDGGGAASSSAVVGGSCTKSNTFTAAGVYTVNVSVTDSDGDGASSTVMIVIYDPSAGFVTGGGTIDSPAGAYPADPLAGGKAIFGFVSKYLKGANTPTGQTHFTFQAASFNFESTAYQWLVVAGAKAQYKGSGTVNGSGNYGFLLTVVDGQISGGGGIDQLRLKVWDAGTGDVVYDNRLGSPEDIDTANPQAIASGSIHVHKGK